jgi:hypothetical protein
MPADGNRAANLRTGDFGTSPIFVQLSDKPLLASVRFTWDAGTKSTMGAPENRPNA